MECEACEMAAFELRADYADLDLDGRHWSELFGGWRGASALGGYVCFNAGTFVVVRHLFAAIAFVAWVLQLVYRYEESASVGYYMTELQHWTVLFTFVYLALAAFLTTVAITYSPSPFRSTRTLLPSSSPDASDSLINGTHTSSLAP